MEFFPSFKIQPHASMSGIVACRKCDVVTINCPLHKSTRGLFDQALLTSMKKGAYLVNTARGAIVDRDALVKVMESGHLAGTGSCHATAFTGHQTA